MIDSKLSPTSNPLSDQAAKSVDGAIQSTRRVANSALDNLSGTVAHVRDNAAPMLNMAASKANAVAASVHRGMDALRAGSREIRTRAVDASDCTIRYVRESPVKSVLMAVGAGALLMILAGLLRGPRSRPVTPAAPSRT